MKQRELKKIKITHKFDCWEDFDLSNKSIYNRILKNQVVISKMLIDEIKCFFEANGIYDIMPDFYAKKFDYSEKCRNKEIQKFCDYFREYIEYWIHSEIKSSCLCNYKKMEGN